MRRCSSPVVPGWLAERTQTIDKWRAARRFRSLAYEWRANRLRVEREAGDSTNPDEDHDEAYARLEGWRYHDEHLERWESAQRRKTLGRRREHYRILAAGLAERYAELLLPSAGRAKARQLPGAESDAPKMPALNRMRNRVAAHELERCLRDAFTARGGTVTEIPRERLSGAGSPGTARSKQNKEVGAKKRTARKITVPKRQAARRVRRKRRE